MSTNHFHILTEATQELYDTARATADAATAARKAAYKACANRADNAQDMAREADQANIAAVSAAAKYCSALDRYLSENYLHVEDREICDCGLDTVVAEAERSMEGLAVISGEFNVFRYTAFHE